MPDLELTNELATFLIVNAVDPDVEPESNPKKGKLETVNNSAEAYLPF